VAHVLLVSALQFRDPVAEIVLMKPGDALIHGPIVDDFESLDTSTIPNPQSPTTQRSEIEDQQCTKHYLLRTSTSISSIRSVPVLRIS
jgi:hypothetical protein